MQRCCTLLLYESMYRIKHYYCYNYYYDYVLFALERIIPPTEENASGG